MNSNNQEKLVLSSVCLPRRGFLWALSLVLAMAMGAWLERWTFMAGIPPDATDDFRLMAQAWNIIQHYYVDKSAAKSAALTYGAISGMTDALGDTGHSVFMTPAMVKNQGNMMRSSLTGIGVEIQMKDRQVVVVAPLDGSPAQRAGVRPGDIILEVAGKGISGLPIGEIITRVSGPAGTPVKLTLLEPSSGRRRELTIVRAAIKISNISWQRLPGSDVVQLRLAMFSDGVAKDLRQELSRIQQQNVKGIILDLRNNPGGVLDEAVGVASQFLSSGNVLLERDAKGKIKPVPVQPGGNATSISMAVLINGGSASASEIVAGALHDADRAKLIGETTFGTGTVLTRFPLLDGSALLLAIEEWLTPSGHSFWHKGINPDISVFMASDVMPLTPTPNRTLTAAELAASGDKQLLSALSLLTQSVESRRN
jgi:carboxyl-terminal processing protease